MLGLAIGAVAPLFQAQTSARQDELLTIPDRRHEAKMFAEGKFDAALLLTNSFRSALTVRRAGIQQRWGFGVNMRGFLLSRRCQPPRARIHQSAYYAALVEALGFAVTETIPRITLGPETLQRASEMLLKLGIARSATLVGFAPGAAYGHAKRWPPARVAAVITRLAHERGVTSILVGAQGDREAGREIESALPAGVESVNLIGRTDLRQVAGILARCAAFVSNDSGAMHLAAAVGVPVTAIFGPTDERVTAPLGDHDVILREVFCRPCMLRDCPIDHRCMQRISADDVFAAVAARLAGHRRTRTHADRAE